MESLVLDLKLWNYSAEKRMKLFGRSIWSLHKERLCLDILQ